MKARTLHPLSLWTVWVLVLPLVLMAGAAILVATSDARTLVFDNPHLWWIGVVPPGVGGLSLYGLIRRRRALQRFASPTVAPLLAPSISPSRQAFRGGMLVTALVLIAAALIGPRWGMYLEKQRVSGVDVVVALDVSRSMLAQDLEPNRIERAKRELRQQLTERGAFRNAHRLGLLAFAGTTSLRLPLTTDHVAFRSKLEAVRVGSVPRGGTAIAQAIRAAVDLFNKSPQEATKVLLLCTDGEDHEGGPVDEARAAWTEHGVHVYTVGIGDPARSVGAEVPAGEGASVRPLLRDGQIVFSKLDLEGLRRIAESGGGECSTISDLPRTIDRVAAMRSTELTTEERMRHRPQYQWFLAAALLLLTLEPMMSEVRKRNGALVVRTWQQEQD